MADQFSFDASDFLRKIQSENLKAEAFDKAARDVKVLFDSFINAGFTEEQTIKIITAAMFRSQEEK